MFINLNTEVRGFVWSEIIITFVAGFCWHFQTFFMIFVFADDFSVYSLLMLLLKPSIRSPVKPGGWHGAYVIFTTILSAGVIAVQFSHSYTGIAGIPPCSPTWLLIHFLLTPFRGVDFRDIISFIVNLITCVVCFQLPSKINYEFRRPKWSQLSPQTWEKIASFHCAAWLFVAGCMWPSILSAPYFMCALGCAIAWAWNIPCLSARTFRWVMRALLVVTIAHQFLLLCYQQPWPQRSFPPSDTLVRLMGITKLMPIPCLDESDTAEMYPVIPARLNPLVILFLFFAIRSFLRGLNSKQVEPEYESETESMSTSPSLLNEEEQGEEKETNLEDLLLGTVNNTVMMVWSVVFHSWLGFLMLLWANVMWMVPRQNSAMGISSRALSIYASVLLLASFCFSVDYEWPSHFGAISLQQFGLLTGFSTTLTPLLIKCGFTLTFMVVLRQYTRPYFVGLRIPVSGFKHTVQVLCLMWVRCAFLVGIIVMNSYDNKTYKTNSISGTLAIVVAIIFPRNIRIPLLVFFLGLLTTCELKLALIYTYQFDGSPEFFDSIFSAFDIATLEQTFGLQVLPKKRLLVHLWLPTLAAMLSAIFLTVVAKDMYTTYAKCWWRWKKSAQRFLITSADPDMYN